MSRIGKQPIPLPAGVKIEVSEAEIRVSGSKVAQSVPLPHGISCRVEDGQALLGRADDTKSQRSLHGLTRALLANAVHGVTQGYKRELDIVGVGYKAVLEGSKVTFNVGYSHSIEFPIPPGIQIAVEKATHVVITGHDKQQVGQVAAQIRSMKKPEPYKGKGIMYTGETIVRKAGKAAK